MRWIHLLSIICLFFGSQVISSPSEKIVISASLKQCDSKAGDVFCNFQSSEIEEVYLNPEEANVKKYFVHNVKKLHLDESVCTNVAFNSISEIVIEGKKNETCIDGFEFAAKDSNINKIPENVKKIYLEKCNVTSIMTDRSLEKLTFLSSRIDVLNISGPFKNGASVLFKESHIGKVEKLIFDDGSKLTIKDSSFVYVPPDSILIHTNATLIQERVSGAFKYTNIETSNRESQKELAENSNEDRGSNISVFVGIGVGIGTLLVIIIAIVLTVMYKRSHKKSNKKSTDVEGGNKENENTISNEETQPFMADGSGSGETELMRANKGDQYDGISKNDQQQNYSYRKTTRTSWLNRNRQTNNADSPDNGNCKHTEHYTHEDLSQMNTRSDSDEESSFNTTAPTNENHASTNHDIPNEPSIVQSRKSFFESKELDNSLSQGDTDRNNKDAIEEMRHKEEEEEKKRKEEEKKLKEEEERKRKEEEKKHKEKEEKKCREEAEKRLKEMKANSRDNQSIVRQSSCSTSSNSEYENNMANPSSPNKAQLTASERGSSLNSQSSSSNSSIPSGKRGKSDPKNQEGKNKQDLENSRRESIEEALIVVKAYIQKHENDTKTAVTQNIVKERKAMLGVDNSSAEVHKHENNKDSMEEKKHKEEEEKKRKEAEKKREDEKRYENEMKSNDLQSPHSTSRLPQPSKHESNTVPRKSDTSRTQSLVNHDSKHSSKSRDKSVDHVLQNRDKQNTGKGSESRSQPKQEMSLKEIERKLLELKKRNNLKIASVFLKEKEEAVDITFFGSQQTQKIKTEEDYHKFVVELEKEGVSQEENKQKNAQKERISQEDKEKMERIEEMFDILSEIRKNNPGKIKGLDGNLGNEKVVFKVPEFRDIVEIKNIDGLVRILNKSNLEISQDLFEKLQKNCTQKDLLKDLQEKMLKK